MDQAGKCGWHVLAPVTRFPPWSNKWFPLKSPKRKKCKKSLRRAADSWWSRSVPPLYQSHRLARRFCTCRVFLLWCRRWSPDNIVGKISISTEEWMEDNTRASCFHPRRQGIHIVSSLIRNRHSFINFCGHFLFCSFVFAFFLSPTWLKPRLLQQELDFQQKCKLLLKHPLFYILIIT